MRDCIGEVKGKMEREEEVGYGETSAWCLTASGLLSKATMSLNSITHINQFHAQSFNSITHTTSNSTN
jgi:hypothetical protein